VRFDARYTIRGIDLNTHNMRLFPQTTFDQLNARGTAAPSDRDVERL